MAERDEKHDRAEWQAWLALSVEERRRRLMYARQEADADGWTDNRILAGKILHELGAVTWEDVGGLRATAKLLGNAGGVWTENVPRILNLADKLESLLPPREEKP